MTLSEFFPRYQGPAKSMEHRITAPNPRRVATLRAFARIASVIIWLISCAVLIGWLTNNETLKRIHPHLVAMNPLTATNFILAGASLWLLRAELDDGRRTVAHVLGGVIALTGALALPSILLGQPGIDQWLFHDRLGIGSLTPNRMSPTTATNFLLMGLALLMADIETADGTRPAQFLSMITAWVALLALVGYVYGTSSLYQIKAFIPMAPHTATTFLVLALGLLSVRPDRGLMARLTSDSAGGAMLRRLGIIIIGVPLALGWLTLIGEKANLFDTAFRFSVFVVLVMIIFSLTLWANAISLDRKEDELDMRVQERTADLAKVLAEIGEGINVLSASTAQILHSSTQLASSATDTATAVVQTTTTVEEIRQSAQVSSQNAQRVAESAQGVARISQSGTQSTEAVGAGMARIREQMESIAESMVRLSEHGQDIGQIIATVDDLAQQSNLLAVNAAIEAAHAGEQGKGFAVVAREVKSLAEQSRQATTQVRTILSDIQNATGTAVMATDQGGKAVEAGVEQSGQAGESIQALAESIAEAAQASLRIAASSRQQLAGMDQVATAMGYVKDASTRNADSARQLEESARTLNALGLRLKQLMAQYD